MRISTENPAEVEHRLTLVLSDREAKILSALADLPIWEDQDTEVAEFLEDFTNQLAEATGADEFAGNYFTGGVTV